MAVDLEARMLAVQPFHDVMSGRISLDEYYNAIKPLYRLMRSRDYDLRDPAIDEVWCWTELFYSDIWDFRVDPNTLNPHVKEHVDILMCVLNSEREHVMIFNPLSSTSEYDRPIDYDIFEFLARASWLDKHFFILDILDIRDLLRWVTQRFHRKDK